MFCRLHLSSLSTHAFLCVHRMHMRMPFECIVKWFIYVNAQIDQNQLATVPGKSFIHIIILLLIFVSKDILHVRRSPHTPQRHQANKEIKKTRRREVRMCEIIYLCINQIERSDLNRLNKCICIYRISFILRTIINNNKKSEKEITPIDSADQTHLSRYNTFLFSCCSI